MVAMKVDKTQFDALLRKMVEAEPVKREDIKKPSTKPGSILPKQK
jgi:hypothetical protein